MKKRAATSDSSVKDFCELLNNAFHGKAMEKVKNKLRIFVTTDTDILQMGK